MRNRSASVTFEELRRLFYCEAGQVFWKVNVGVGGRIKAGTKAGSRIKSGYVTIHTKMGQIQAHHVTWALANGRMPEHPIDHINGDRADNRPENLREAPGGLNQQNQRGAQKNSKTGVLGVIAYRKGFRATIRRGARGVYLGDFETIEEAAAAYLAAKRAMHEGCTI